MDQISSPNIPNILSLTQKQYLDHIEKSLGKGMRHAALLYSEWMREGTHKGSDAAFSNAARLYSQILEETDFSLPDFVRCDEDAGTRKFLLRTGDALESESVLIPMPAGDTLCLSSQIGCRLGCAFCETGKMGLIRHLRPEEIVGQLHFAKHQLAAEVRNVVFMGMGEPLDNYENVVQAIRVLRDPMGFNMGKRNITVSSSGCVDQLRRFMSEPDIAVNLAVSVNAPNDDIRSRLMPINRKFNMKALYEVMDDYCRSSGEQILAAYVLIKGLNDQPEHAEELSRYLKGLNVKVNLIPYNPQYRDRFDRPDDQTIRNFKEVLIRNDYQTLLRLPRGRDIMAACGQLGNQAFKRKLRGEQTTLVK